MSSCAGGGTAFHVAGRLEIDTGLELPDDAAYHAGETIRARLIGTNGLDPGVNGLMLLDGQYPQDRRDGMLLETHFAENYGYGPGTVLNDVLSTEG